MSNKEVMIQVNENGEHIRNVHGAYIGFVDDLGNNVLPITNWKLEQVKNRETGHIYKVKNLFKHGSDIWAQVETFAEVR